MKSGPDFIIGGAPRSGTTWLCHLLDRHPDIHMAKPFSPEPKYFLVDDVYDKGFDYYVRNWFSDVADDKIAGEKSTNYLESEEAARRIHRHLPDVKLIFIFREPVARAFSNYLWSRMNGLEEEDFRTALELEDKRESEVTGKARYSRPHAYFSRGLYADLLKPYFELFPEDNILCLRFEDVHDDTHMLVSKLHSFLGVTPRPEDADGLGVINESEKDGQVIPVDIAKILSKRYSEPNKTLSEMLGKEFKIWRT